MRPTEHNERGYWESFLALNEEILAVSGTEWREWRRLDPERMDLIAAAAFKAGAMMARAAEFGDTSFRSPSP